MIQFVSQVWPPSADRACSHRHVVGVMSDPWPEGSGHFGMLTMATLRRTTMTTSDGQIVPFVPFVRPGAGPLYRQIYDGYRMAVLSGRLRPGQRLPSTRALAAELEISRLPALSAFEQLLHEGYIEGKVGAGTYVAQAIPDDLTRAADTPDAHARAPRKSRRLTPRDEGGLG